MPSAASASVRAMMTKSSVRASTAALMRSTISSLANEALARTVAAALGLDLVLDVHAGGAGADHLLHGAGDVEGAAPAGVGVDEQRQLGDVGDAPHVLEDVVEAGQAQVRQSVGGGCHAASGEVERAIADTLGHDRVVGVDRPDDLQRVLLGDSVAQTRAGAGLVRHLVLHVLRRAPRTRSAVASLGGGPSIECRRTRQNTGLDSPVKG